MKKQCLCLAVAAALLTACAPGKNTDDISKSSPFAPKITLHSETKDGSPGTESMATDDFDGQGRFGEYASLIGPTAVSGIEYVGKTIDRYIFAFPDNEAEARSLYNEYGAILQADGFILEEYEGNYIIKDGDESVAFMGTGHNEDYDYIMMMAFYPGKE